MDKISEFCNLHEAYIRLAAGSAVFLILLIFRKIISGAILSVLGRIFHSKTPEKRKSFKSSLEKPVSFFIALFGLYSGIYINYQSSIITDIFKIIVIMNICWGVLCFISDNLYEHLSLKSNNAAVNGIAVKFISNLLKVITVCIAVVMVLSELGYNINGLITGLGVGGLAVSLAAQDTLKNLISGFVILFDKPFDVGDLIETPEFKGFVEDVTMRSTRIRKLDDSVIIVPNSALADASISNYARLTKRLVEFKIGLLYSTSSDTIKSCEEDIKVFLKNHELVDAESVRVCFLEYDDSSVNIQIRCYINTIEAPVYFEFMEELNFKIKDIVDSNGTDFAFPTRSIYIERK